MKLTDQLALAQDVHRALAALELLSRSTEPNAHLAPALGNLRHGVQALTQDLRAPEAQELLRPERIQHTQDSLLVECNKDMISEQQIEETLRTLTSIASPLMLLSIAERTLHFSGVDTSGVRAAKWLADAAHELLIMDQSTLADPAPHEWTDDGLRDRHEHLVQNINSSTRDRRKAALVRTATDPHIGTARAGRQALGAAKNVTARKMT